MPHDAAATRHDLVWSSVAAALLIARPTVAPPHATDLLLAVRDPVSFRVAISIAVRGTTRPRGLDQLVAEVQSSLQPPAGLARPTQPSAGPAPAYGWFERRTFYPPQLMPPSHQAPTHPLYPSSLPLGLLLHPTPPKAPTAPPTGLLPPSLAEAPD